MTSAVAAFFDPNCLDVAKEFLVRHHLATLRAIRQNFFSFDFVPPTRLRKSPNGLAASRMNRIGE
jgi:hypothetical protein